MRPDRHLTESPRPEAMNERSTPPGPEPSRNDSKIVRFDVVYIHEEWHVRASNSETEFIHHIPFETRREACELRDSILEDVAARRPLPIGHWV